ncbi:MAG: glycoside hydrolase family 2 TIM barrel-domain containing protein [Candidatus Omnitrophota bacterium]
MKLSSNNNSSMVIKVTGYKRFLLVACSFLFIFILSACQSRPGVYIQKLKNQNYRLMVNSRPYIVKGVCYNPIPIGETYTYDWWSDPNKPWLVDGKLMKEMGVNTVRLYQTYDNSEKVKQVIRDLYNLYGIRTLLGDWLGFWEYPCPFYGDQKFQDKIRQQVLEMVRLYKDEPGVLGWILGNENNYSCLGHVNPWSSPEVDLEPDPQKQKLMRAKIYYSFVNEISQAIHKIDKQHPVGLGNGELVGLDSANKYCQDVDFVACIIYRGKTFGNLFKSLKATFDKPILLAEFGADCYDAYLKKEDQDMQAFFLQSQWSQIYENLANNKLGAGNCLGGTIFEWTDEWWKHNPDDPAAWKVHDTLNGWSNGSYYFDIRAAENKNMDEEWFGIVALGENIENEVTVDQGLNKRIPRKAYYVVREFWKNPVTVKNQNKK